MSMDTQIKQQHALRIARDILSRADFLDVVEDELIDDASDDDLRDIHDLIRDVEVSFAAPSTDGTETWES